MTQTFVRVQGHLWIEKLDGTRVSPKPYIPDSPSIQVVVV